MTIEKMIEDLKARKAELQGKVDTAETKEALQGIMQECRSIDQQIKNLEDVLKTQQEERAAVPETAQHVNGQMAKLGTFKRSESADVKDSEEYRKAFMDYVLRNKPMPAEFRGDANTKTTDVASVIPTVIVNRIVEQLTSCGMILPEVTRTAFAAGVVVPTSSTKPVASWVNEGAGSDKQKETTGSITFSHFKLRCEISMSMEVGTMALAVFENTFVRNVSDAMIVALEKAILAGTGSGQPTGILAGTVSNVVTSAKASGVSYADLVAMEAALPVQYEGNAKWFMTKAQYMAFVGMVDSAGQPIARVDHGIDGRPARMLLGREVIIHPYATEMGDDVAGLYNFRDYILNTVYDLGIQKKQDWDTEDLLTKAVMAVDGKPVDLGSLVVLEMATESNDSDVTPEG